MGQISYHRQGIFRREYKYRCILDFVKLNSYNFSSYIYEKQTTYKSIMIDFNYLD